ncbi:hypothetical protein CDAR_240551 [Caerostris darwini]|uniref:Uncharacterized protein n=1 Tax=Caerostris darwini TaxID=1538125 RepID=A0AAV4PQN1_9ARAC|nr:hypothetical protein CDAR_240551 [Caerostris darwini]
MENNNKLDSNQPPNLIKKRKPILYLEEEPFIYSLRHKIISKLKRQDGKKTSEEEEEEEPEAVEDRQQRPSWASPCDKDAISHPSTGEISTTRVAGDVNKEPPCHLRQSLTMTN